MINITSERIAGLKCPCAPGCENRNSDCHCTCEPYLEYEMERLKLINAPPTPKTTAEHDRNAMRIKVQKGKY